MSAMVVAALYEWRAFTAYVVFQRSNRGSKATMYFKSDSKNTAGMTGVQTAYRSFADFNAVIRIIVRYVIGEYKSSPQKHGERWAAFMDTFVQDYETGHRFTVGI